MVAAKLGIIIKMCKDYLTKGAKQIVHGERYKSKLTLKPLTSMNYKIEDIEGIGSVYGEKLREAGVTTTADLLARGATRKGREELAEATGISPALILTWTNHADLFRIHGVASQFAELLEASGVDTVKELRHRNAENLHERMLKMNDLRGLCDRVPSVKELEKMIAEAANLEPVMTY